MPRHTFLDAILNRPSQHYAATDPSASSALNRERQRWDAPSDLPNAPAAQSLKGSLFGKKSRTNLRSDQSDAGGSTTTSVRSRFGRKKRGSVVGDYTFNNGPGRMPTTSASMSQIASHTPMPGASLYHAPAPPSSIADSQATYSRRKSRWWEAGSLGFGRKSRTPSIAGDSIFSEPEPPQDRFHGIRMDSQALVRQQNPSALLIVTMAGRPQGRASLMSHPFRHFPP